MKKTFLLSLFSILVLVSLSSCQESKGERFKREAQEFTKTKCPSVSADGVIRTDSMVFHNDGTNDMIYYYTILDESSEAVLIRNMASVEAELRRGIINSVDMRHQKEANLNFIYIYRSVTTGKEVMKFKFTSQDY